jgi:hypothetical protein
MKKALALGKLFLFSPSEAARVCQKDEALYDALKLYALTLLGAALFHWWKPYDFPDANAAVPGVVQGFIFWLKVMMWQPLLMAVLIGLCGALLHWMKDGWLPFKIFTSVFWTAIPFILMLCYLPTSREAGPTTLSKTQYGILFALWCASAAGMIRLTPKAVWRPLASFLLAMNVVELASFIPQIIVTLLRWEAGYKAVVSVTGLWMLLAGAFGLKSLPPPRPLPRTLFPLIFSLLLQIAVVFAAFTLNWLPMETLKALMYG